MKIRKLATYLGPSLYAQSPTVRYAIDELDLPATPSTGSAWLSDLSGFFPDLSAHAGGCGGLPRAVSTEPGVPADIGHLFEHVCIELQNAVGLDIGCVRSESEGGAAVESGEAVVCFGELIVCEEAARLATDLLNHLRSPEAGEISGENEAFDFKNRIEEFNRLAERVLLPVQDRALMSTARARDIPAVRLAGRVIQLGQGRYQQRLSATKTNRTNVVSNDLAANKDYTRRILGDLGLPIPRYERVHTRRDAVEAARRIGYPVVVKPNNGNMGAGVSVAMKNRREVTEAYRRARAFSRSVLVEEMLEGADYRMLVIDGELIAAAQRIPGHVRGDGVRTIEALLEEVNADPRRGSGQRSPWSRIEIDEQAERLLEDRGMTRLSVPGQDEVVYLRRNANTSDGGTAVDVTDEVHPENREIAVRAAKAIGLDIAGVDFLVPDITRSMRKQGGAICEVNSRPGLRKHMWPAAGESRDVTTPIVDMLFPSSDSARVPVVAVCGTGNTRRTARLLGHMLEASGRRVGLVIGRRVRLGSRRVSSERFPPAKAADMVFLDPEVDVAVIAIPPGEISQYGLGTDVFDVCAIVNASSSTSRSETKASEAGDHRAELDLLLRCTRGAVIVGEDPDFAEGLVQRGIGPAVIQADERRWERRMPKSLREFDDVDLVRCVAIAGASAHRLGERAKEIKASLVSYRLRRRGSSD